MSQRHGGPEAKVSLQLPLQAGHEEREKLPAYLLEHVPESAGYASAALTSTPRFLSKLARQPQSTQSWG